MRGRGCTGCGRWRDFGGHSGAAGWNTSDSRRRREPVRIAWTGTGATEQGRNAPHAGPDSTRIYVWAGSEGLLSMRYDGTDIKTVVRVTGLGLGGAPGSAAA